MIDVLLPQEVPLCTRFWSLMMKRILSPRWRSISRPRATISFKNVSRDELNISPDELMERFVRGDASRHTEGSGLGLSIARSLVQLQGGRFDLAIDADLFRADITFPLSESAAS